MLWASYHTKKNTDIEKAVNDNIFLLYLSISKFCLFDISSFFFFLNATDKKSDQNFWLQLYINTTSYRVMQVKVGIRRDIWILDMPFRQGGRMGLDHWRRKGFNFGAINGCDDLILPRETE